MQRAIGAVLACLILSGAAADGAFPPVPPRRPANLYPPRDIAAEIDDACLARLNASGVEYESFSRKEDGACVIATPVRLYALAPCRNAGSPISFPAGPLIDCRLAERLADWLREAVSPLFREHLGSSLRAVATGAGYECRTRNREPDSKLSAHGLGLALDIAAFELVDRERVGVAATDDRAVEDTVEAIRKSACGWFTTVLGPGSPDHLHETHLHVDVQPHGLVEGYRICQ